MSTHTWETFHRRSQLLHAAVEHIERTGGSRPPWDDVPGLAEIFGTSDQLLLALYQWWETTLGSRIDQALEQDSHHQPSSVTAAWTELAREYPGLRRLLDHAATDSALATALHHEYRLLAVAAGLATMGDPHDEAVATGMRLIDHERARQDHTDQARGEHTVVTAPYRHRPWWRRIVVSPA